MICATGDKANPDMALHAFPPTDPYEHSYNVVVYGNKAGGSE